MIIGTYERKLLNLNFINLKLKSPKDVTKQCRINKLFKNIPKRKPKRIQNENSHKQTRLAN